MLLARIVEKFEGRKPNRKQRLYMQLYSVLQKGIANKDLPAGMHLPPTRKLAEALQISRSTVNKSYELLSLEGYISSKAGSGYLILDFLVGSKVKALKTKHNSYPALSEIGESFLRNINLINPTDDKSVAFRPGLPPLDIFPVNQWKNLSNLYWRHIKASSLSYYPSSGIEPLKKSLANYLNLVRNIKCDHRQIIIVSGSLQSLYLIGKVLVNSGDTILMENPTFPNVHTIFKSMNAHIEALTLDDEGVLVEELDQRNLSAPKLVHVTPTNHYPSCIRMSLERRQELLAWASANKCFILENDYEHEVSNSRNEIPSLFTLDQEDRTIYMGTFNRLLHPSIRLGYMVVPTYLLDAVQALQKLSHRFISPSIQILMSQFIEKKHLLNHMKNLKSVALVRKKEFIQAFNEAFEGRLVIEDFQTESLHLMALLNSAEEETTFIKLLQANNIVVHPYSKCFINGKPQYGIIMGYSSLRGPSMKRRVFKMGQLYKEHF